MVQLVHLPASVLTLASAEAAAARPIYSRYERANIAARLRSGLATGRVSAADVRKALAKHHDRGVARIGTSLKRRLGRALAGLRLPPTLTAPIDPYFANPDRRHAIRRWVRGFVQRRVLSPADVDAAVAQGDIAVADMMDSACKRYAEGMLRLVAEKVGAADVADSPLAWTVRIAATTRLPTDTEADVVMYPNEDAGFSVTLVDGLPATPLLIDVCDALRSVHLDLMYIDWPRDLLEGRGGFGDSLIDDIRGYAGDLQGADGTVKFTDDFLEHMQNEYGFDPAGDTELVRRLLEFDKAHPQPSREKPIDPVKQLMALHARPDGMAVGSALPSLMRWAKLSCPYPVTSKVDASALDEDGGTYLSHVVVADVTGFEERAVNEIVDINMSCGAEGAVALRAADPFDALTVALFDVCRITVLDRLLCRLGTAR